MENAHVSSGVKIGAMTGLIAWSCCITGVVLGFLGLGTAAAFFGDIQMKYHWVLVGIAFVSMDFAIYYFMKQYHGACNYKTLSHNYGQVAFIVLIALFSYFLLQAILPPLVELSMPHMM